MTVGAEVSAALIFLLLTKHFICDFLLQNRYQIEGKAVYGHPGGLLHAGIHVAGTAAVAFPFMTPGMLAVALVAEFVVHYHLDWAKERLGRGLTVADGRPFWGLFGLDQLMHQLTYLGIAVWAAYG